MEKKGFISTVFFSCNPSLSCQTDPSFPFNGQNEQRVLLYNRTCRFIAPCFTSDRFRTGGELYWMCLHRKPAPSANWVCAGRTHSRGMLVGRGYRGGGSAGYGMFTQQKILILLCNEVFYEGGMVWAFRPSLILAKRRSWCPTVVLIIYCTDTKNYSIWSDSQSTLHFVIHWYLVSCHLVLEPNDVGCKNA